MENMSIIYDALLENQAENIMNESLNQFTLQRLYADIDIALQTGDRASFLSLTRQLKVLQSIML